MEYIIHTNPQFLIISLNYAQYYDDISLLSDFNVDMQDENLNDFCNLYNLKNLIKEPTCYKNPSNHSCIDPIITNRSNSLEDTHVTDWFIRLP